MIGIDFRNSAKCEPSLEIDLLLAQLRYPLPNGSSTLDRILKIFILPIHSPVGQGFTHLRRSQLLLENGPTLTRAPFYSMEKRDFRNGAKYQQPIEY